MTPTEAVLAPPAIRPSAIQRKGLGALARIEQVLLRPIDVAWLAMFRILFGLALAISMERFIAYGWIESLLLAPRFRFHYWGFGFVEPLGASAMHVLFWVLVGLALAMAAGFAFRITAPLFALGLTYIQLIDVSTYLNHYYLAGLLAWLLAFSPANRAWSIDAWLRRRSSSASVPYAWLVVFRVQIACVYVFAALAKAQPDWLLHGQPLGIWLGAATHLPIIGKLVTIPGAPLAMSWMGFLFDLTIVFWLSWKRTRPWAYAVALVFHALTRVLFDIGMFPIIMSLSALVFFSPSWPRKLLRRPLPKTSEIEKPLRASVLHRVALGFGFVYCALQILVPLRTHLVGGNVLWHEQGMRFSWRVMVRAKGGAFTFVVTEPSGRVTHVTPQQYLTAFQENEMASQPDLVLQLAKKIRTDFEDRGSGPVVVRVDSRVSLNGRPAVPLVDPEIDLGREEDGLGRATWILPGPTEPPPPTRPVP